MARQIVEVDEKMPVRPAGAGLLLELKHPHPERDAQVAHEQTQTALVAHKSMGLLGTSEVIAVEREREHGRDAEHAAFGEQALADLPAIATATGWACSATATTRQEDDARERRRPVISLLIKFRGGRCAAGGGGAGGGGAACPASAATVIHCTSDQHPRTGNNISHDTTFLVQQCTEVAHGWLTPGTSESGWLLGLT